MNDSPEPLFRPSVLFDEETVKQIDWANYYTFMKKENNKNRPTHGGYPGKVVNSGKICEYCSGDGVITMHSGRFQAITPCFRFETHDQFHQKSFIKNELIITDYVDRVHLDIMVSHAQSFFESKLEDAVSIVETSSNSMDIEYKGVELGSYGIRHCEFLSWIYGTGVAEPRFSTVMRNKKFLAEKYELSFKKD
jgi:hypothetical protein